MNVMIDIETLGIESDAVVLNIGAVKFDERLGEQFYTTLNLDEELSNFNRAKASVSAETLLWWFEQGQRFDVSMLPDTQRDDVAVETNHQKLQAFLKFVKDGEFLWSNGMNFDFPILENCLNRYGLKPNWKYYKLRDFRTLQALHGQKATQLYVNTHHALKDALNQTAIAITIFDYLRKNGAKA